MAGETLYGNRSLYASSSGGGGVTEIHTFIDIPSGASSGVTLDWSAQGRTLSEFDLILCEGFFLQSSERNATSVFLTPSAMLSADFTFLCGITFSGTSSTVVQVRLGSVTETSALSASVQSGILSGYITKIQGYKF